MVDQTSEGDKPDLGRVRSCFQWDTLPETVTIPESDIEEKALGVSGDEVYSMFKIGGAKDVLASGIVGKYGFYFPLLDAEMAKAFGVRALIVESKLMPGVNNAMMDVNPEAVNDADAAVDYEAYGIPNVAKDTMTEMEYNQLVDFMQRRDRKSNSTAASKFLTKVKRDRLWRWNRFNHVLESGTLQMKGKPVRVGMKAFLPDEASRGVAQDNGDRQMHRGMQYYVVGVDQTYRFGANWTTGLTLTRGHNDNELHAIHDSRGFNQPAGPTNNVFTGKTAGMN
jgi:hypothetical protein